MIERPSGMWRSRGVNLCIHVYFLFLCLQIPIPISDELAFSLGVVTFLPIDGTGEDGLYAFSFIFAGVLKNLRNSC